MKRIILLIILTFTINAIAQDGSDIKYVGINDIDDSYVGKLVHLDFYNRSFGAFNLDKKDLNDTINIQLENKNIEFKEHRVDNGFNNWFSQQYIESTKFVDGYKIRISMCKIKGIKSDSITVILFLEYRDKNGKTNSEKPNRLEYKFPKKILAEILVRN
ncbi:hypothetical protein [Winogradskyella sediminis]|uniref:Uncharacterized protein n=1 Tax=Winogradskyella sediminis TaxID=1382466 RepID=A0A1H1NG96_9FLAO|nr:hypothetical protein [Winogradskyella sediminis]SDR97840.1 hypothetical protein SAMN04489797_0590 [Winogradskyella sediminis]